MNECLRARSTGAAFLLVFLPVAAALAAGGTARAASPPTVTLNYSGGKCTFVASKVEQSASVLSITGAFGPGCPGYVAPTPHPPAGEGDCSAAAPPPGLTRLTRVTVNGSQNLDATQLASLYGPFPGIAAVKTLTIPKNAYAALEFTVPLVMAPMTISKFSNLSTGTSASFSTSISRCPGDFRATTDLARGCGLSRNSEGNLLFIVDYGAGNRCDIKPGGKYYLNVVHASLGAPTMSTCSASTCTATIKNAPGQ